MTFLDLAREGFEVRITYILELDTLRIRMTKRNMNYEISIPPLLFTEMNNDQAFIEDFICKQLKSYYENVLNAGK